MALAADENALNRAIGIEKNKSLLEKVAEVIKELAQRVKRFIRENTTNEEAKAILDDAEALDMLAELFAQAADEAKENLSGMNEGAIEKENAHRGARYLIRNVSFSEEECKNNSIKLQGMDPITDLTGNEFPYDGTPINKRILAFFNELGNNVYSDVFGDVALNNSSVHDDMGHGKTKHKIAAFKAVPDVIKKGVVIDSQKRGNGKYDRIVVAAPITIANEPYLMGVMLQRDNQSQRLYLHDVVALSRIETIKVGEASPSTTEAATLSDSLYMTSILQRAYNVNNNSENGKQKFAVNDVIDEGYDAPLSDEEEQALWDDEAQRREVDLYNVPKGESYFDSHEDVDIGKLTEESSESAVMILSGSAQNTAEKAIRGFKQFELDEGAIDGMVEDIAKDYEIDLEENPGIAGELRSIVTDFIAQVEEGRISTHMAVSTMMKRIRQQLEHAYRWEIDPEAKRIRDDIIGELRETIRNPIIVRDYEASIIAEEYGIWLAHWASAHSRACDIWQYGENGSIDGVNGDVDVNIIENWDVIGSKPAVIDKYGFTKGNASDGVLAVKELLISAKRKGVITQGVDENNIFGDGTEKAVNQVLKLGGYAETGIAGEGFIKLIVKKL